MLIYWSLCMYVYIYIYIQLHVCIYCLEVSCTDHFVEALEREDSGLVNLREVDVYHTKYVLHIYIYIHIYIQFIYIYHVHVRIYVFICIYIYVHAYVCVFL